MKSYTAIFLLIFGLLYAGEAFASCNTKAGFVENQPTPPPAVDMTEVPANPLDDPEDTNDQEGDRVLDAKTFKINLASDIISLIGLTGQYTDNSPVLGVRIENVPGFNSKRHCNAIEPIVYKPRLVQLADGRIRATVDEGRFKLDFDPKEKHRSWLKDQDKSGHFFWIFPSQAKYMGMKTIASSYNTAFQSIPSGSIKRRWIAEAYLDLSMRYNRLKMLDQGFPQGWRPTRGDMAISVREVTGIDCDNQIVEVICLASRVIEKNETAPPGDMISPSAFTLGDALLQNSGVSTGIRQLDFGTSNEQAQQLIKQIFPKTLGRYRLGRGYRRPIRTWTVERLNRWFDEEGAIANRELSRDEAKKILLKSHSEYLREASSKWLSKIKITYPSWSDKDQVALAVIAIDIQNVTGYVLNLPINSPNLCAVISDTMKSAVNKRSNNSVVADKINRVRNAQSIINSDALNQYISGSCSS